VKTIETVKECIAWVSIVGFIMSMIGYIVAICKCRKNQNPSRDDEGTTFCKSFTKCFKRRRNNKLPMSPLHDDSTHEPILTDVTRLEKTI